MTYERKQLINHILAIREGLNRGNYKNEAAISDGVVKRLLEAVGWPRYDQQVVFPQFRVNNREVDFALCHPAGEPVVLLEVKAVGEANYKAEQQLFGYCYEKHVKIGILTDGLTWKLYYPPGEGGFVDRLFKEFNLKEGDEGNIAEALLQYVAHDVVISGKAVEHSRTTYLDTQWHRLFASVWGKMLQDPDTELVRIFRKRVSEKGESRPERQAVLDFFKRLGTEESVGKRDVVKDSRPLPESNRPDKSRESSEEPGSPFYTLDDVTTHFKTGKEVFTAVFREFAKRDTDFCKRYASTQRTGGKRLELARQAEDLYPPGSKWSRTDASELPGGWWLATHLSNELKDKRIQRACDVAGVKFGRDLIVSLSK